MRRAHDGSPRELKGSWNFWAVLARIGAVIGVRLRPVRLDDVAMKVE